MENPAIRLIVLDELNIALRYDHLDIKDVVQALKARRQDQHIVVTGRNAKPELIEAADLVTEMTPVKHHFAAGVKAQEASILMSARALMIQGTGSDVRQVDDCGRPGPRLHAARSAGASVQAAEHVEQCRGHQRRWRDRRAQALQARAARVPPSVHMNPVLLKPQSDVGAQVVVQGKVLGNAKAREYQGLKPKLLGAVLESFGRLAAEGDLVLVEGAGSARRSICAPTTSPTWASRAPPMCRRAAGRHRPRRRHREPGRHQDGDRSGRCRHDRGLHRQPLPRRSVIVRRRHENDRPSHRLAGAGIGAVFRRRAPIAGRRRIGAGGARLQSRVFVDAHG